MRRALRVACPPAERLWPPSRKRRRPGRPWVELRGLEPLTPTLPVWSRRVRGSPPGYVCAGQRVARTIADWRGSVRTPSAGHHRGAHTLTLERHRDAAITRLFGLAWLTLYVLRSLPIVPERQRMLLVATRRRHLRRRRRREGGSRSACPKQGDSPPSTTAAPARVFVLLADRRMVGLGGARLNPVWTTELVSPRAAKLSSGAQGLTRRRDAMARRGGVGGERSLGLGFDRGQLVAAVCSACSSEDGGCRLTAAGEPAHSAAALRAGWPRAAAAAPAGPQSEAPGDVCLRVLPDHPPGINPAPAIARRAAQ